MRFTELAKANVDYYNEHPAAHATLTVVLAVATAVLFNKAVQLACKQQPINVYYTK